MDKGQFGTSIQVDEGTDRTAPEPRLGLKKPTMQVLCPTLQTALQETFLGAHDAPVLIHNMTQDIQLCAIS